MGCTAVALYFAFRDVHDHEFISSTSETQAPGPEIAGVCYSISSATEKSFRKHINNIATRAPGGGKAS